jgi:hypothetical protein
MPMIPPMPFFPPGGPMIIPPPPGIPTATNGTHKSGENEKVWTFFL